MEKQLLAKLLRKLEFSASLPESVLDRLASTASIRTFPAKSILFREKSENNRLMILCAGRVALDMQVPGQGNVRLLILEPGELLAWSAIVLQGRMTSTATALDDVKVVSLSADELMAACETDHSLGFALMRRIAVSLAERLIDTRSQLIDLLTFNNALALNPNSS